MQGVTDPLLQIVYVTLQYYHFLCIYVTGLLFVCGGGGK